MAMLKTQACQQTIHISSQTELLTFLPRQTRNLIHNLRHTPKIDAQHLLNMPDDSRGHAVRNFHFNEVRVNAPSNEYAFTLLHGMGEC